MNVVRSFRSAHPGVAFFTALILIGIAGAGCTPHHKHQARTPLTRSVLDTSNSRRFASPAEAADSLAAAVRSGVPDHIKDVLGPDAEELVRSGDPVQDDNHEARFTTLYDERHELIPVGDDGNTVALCIGKSQWPFAIPLVKDSTTGMWRFDTARGKDEIINRRIGDNELSAIQVCLAIVDAEYDYVARPIHGTGWPQYADRFISDEGKTNGLFWRTGPNDSPSPLGPLVGAAAEEGYTPGTHLPYHGYFYRILTAQGPHADGGAYDYMMDGKLVAGFAIIARPAYYGVSGVMTFIVNHDGVVYQRNLGPETDTIAKAIKTFDPDSGWQKVE